MKKSWHVIAVIFVIFVLVSTGCIRRKKTTQEKPKVYVEPCTISTIGVKVRINADKLIANDIKDDLEFIYTDNFNLPGAENIRKTYTLACYWGRNVDEKPDRYYCLGKYRAPELDETNTIKRIIWKEFKIGFDVDTHEIKQWVDDEGVTHKSDTVHYLTVAETYPKCYLAE